MSLKSLAVVALVVATAVLTACDPTTGTGEQPNAKTAHSIPENYLALYQANGGTCAGLDWAILAAIGKLESDHGRSTLPGVRSGANGSGAQGPLQFMPATYKSVRGRHPEIGRNVHDPRNAVPAAAHLLCDNGATTNLRKAIWRYNHSDKYVNQVLAQAKEYRR